MRRARILSRKPGPRTRLSQDWMPSEKTTLILRCLLEEFPGREAGTAEVLPAVTVGAPTIGTHSFILCNGYPGDVLVLL
ncbi:hypothetical protein GBAR_LOCUS8497 [Geodia barretti]|uniref:Uncharacterized protein n=1 Tax=Geodia barretti TaxID=519541 RepID=A0AA35WAG9_GEOBA|nr:hypothetical protein GBAR_LOCUS8497 [Geodia barretti]